MERVITQIVRPVASERLDARLSLGSYRCEALDPFFGFAEAGEGARQWPAAAGFAVLSYAVDDARRVAVWIMGESALAEVSATEPRREGGVEIRSIFDEREGRLGPCALWLDVTLAPDATLTHALSPRWSALVYPLAGEPTFGESLASAVPLDPGEMGLLGPGDTLSAAERGEGGRYLLLAGRPLGRDYDYRDLPRLG